MLLLLIANITDVGYFQKHPNLGFVLKLTIAKYFDLKYNVCIVVL